MLPPIQLKYYLSECWHTLTGLTFALGGAKLLTLFKILLTNDCPLNSMFPPKIVNLFTCKKNIRIQLFFYVDITTVYGVCNQIWDSSILLSSILFYCLFSRIYKQIWNLWSFKSNQWLIREFINYFLRSLGSLLAAT